MITIDQKQKNTMYFICLILNIFGFEKNLKNRVRSLIFFFCFFTTFIFIGQARALKLRENFLIFGLETRVKSFFLLTISYFSLFCVKNHVCTRLWMNSFVFQQLSTQLRIKVIYWCHAQYKKRKKNLLMIQMNYSFPNIFLRYIGMSLIKELQ